MSDKKRNKGIRSLWTEADLRKAIAAVNRGLSVNSVSNMYPVPRKTLSRYVKKRKQEKLPLGRRTVLCREDENELCRRIIRLADVGYPLTNRILRRCVFNYCQENNIKNKFSQEKKMAGRYWLKGFLGRHRDISNRRAQNMNPARAQKMNKFIVNDYFHKLRETLVELDIMDKPERIYNVDEKGCRLSLHHQQTVLAKKGAKRVHLVAPEHGENITVVSCGSASGVAIPPAILFKGQRMKPEWTDNLPPGSLALMTPRGSMTVDSFKIWLEHLGKYKLQGRCLLIFDGASCHLDPSIVDIAEAHEIKLLCLPSNTTHELQPMDKCVFRSFEHHWDEQVLLFWAKYKNRSITKQRFGEIFSIVWDKAMTPANIKSGFLATGIFPYNPDVIPEAAFAPSVLTELPDINQQEQTERTPSPDLRTSQQPLAPLNKNVAKNPLSSQPGCSYKITNRKWSNDLSKKRKKESMSSSSSESSVEYSFEKSSDDEENSVSDEAIDNNSSNTRLNTSFTKMLETPYKVADTAKRKRKAINSRALVVTRDVFADKTNKSAPKRSQSSKKDAGIKSKNILPSKPKQKEKKKYNESWYCKICNKDEKQDMRLCSLCATYVHEVCVGLTKNDIEIFICPDCDS